MTDALWFIGAEDMLLLLVELDMVDMMDSRLLRGMVA